MSRNSTDSAISTMESVRAAHRKGVKVLVFPELTLTGCTCYDLYTQRTLLDGAKRALVKLLEATNGLDMLILVGLPYLDGTRLYSCAAALYAGGLLGLVPRTEVAGTHFAAPDKTAREISIDGIYSTYLIPDTLFVSNCIPDLAVAVELGADMDAVNPPAVRHALGGATVIAQMASFPMASKASFIRAPHASLRAQQRSSSSGPRWALESVPPVRAR